MSLKKPATSNVKDMYSGNAVRAFLKYGERIKNALSPKDTLPPIDEGWWIDVVYDRRGRWPKDDRLPNDSPHAYLRIDRFKKQVIVLTCNRCKIRHQFTRDDLLKEFGRDYNRVVMRYVLQPCPNHHSDAVFVNCRLEYEECD
jgi:hypothetical protein